MLYRGQAGGSYCRQCYERGCRSKYLMRVGSLHTLLLERPDEEEASAGVRDAAGDTDTLPPHVDDGDG